MDKEITVNTTFKISREHVIAFEEELRSIPEIDVRDFKFLRDNSDIADRPGYKKLLSEYYEIKRKLEDYINEWGKDSSTTQQ